MMNIFFIFDPCTSLSFSMNWISSSLIFLLMPFQYWWMPSRYTYMFIKIISFIFKEFKIIINYSYSNLIMFTSLLVMIFFNNFLGLFPYIFTSSSHLSFCFSLSLSLWLSMILFSLFNYFNIFLSHLTPQGTPLFLMPFMVMIESISLIIRPLTLGIRLSANIIAGHLLLTLMGSSEQYIKSLLLMMLIMMQSLLFLLEISISLIQAYVFSILSTLYSSET